jgi:hypothetical protein
MSSDLDVHLNLWFPPIKHVEKAWGWEKHLHNDSDFCCKLLSVNQGCSCSIHWHKKKREMFLANQGTVLVEVWPTLPENWEEDIVAIEQNLLSRHCKRFILKPYSKCWLPELHAFVNEVDFTYRIMIDQLVPHRFTGLEGGSMFFEASTEDSESDSYRAIESKGTDSIPTQRG